MLLNLILNNYFFIFLLILSFDLCANEERDKEEAQVTSTEIITDLDSLKNLPLGKFIDKMELVSKKMSDYIKVREQRCSGDFTSFIIDAKGNKKFQTNKLTRAERRLCQYTLINFQIEAVKKAHIARKRFLIQNQKVQIEELDKLNKSQILNLEKIARKYKK